MTPAIDAARKAGIRFRIHQYQHDPAAESYGLEAAEALGVEASHVFKTLLAQLDNGQLVVAIIPVDRQLDLKSLAAACKARKASMAPVAAAERSSGYVAGGISPLGQRKRLPTLIDESVVYAACETAARVSRPRRLFTNAVRLHANPPATPYEADLRP